MVEKEYGRKRPLIIEGFGYKGIINDALKLKAHFNEEEWPLDLKVILESLNSHHAHELVTGQL